MQSPVEYFPTYAALTAHKDLNVSVADSVFSSLEGPQGVYNPNFALLLDDKNLQQSVSVLDNLCPKFLFYVREDYKYI